VSTNETRRFSAWFLARGRVPAFAWVRGTSFFTVCALGRDGRVFVWSRIMHEVSLFAEPGRMEFGIIGTVHLQYVGVCSNQTTIEHETRRHSTRLPRAPSQCPLTQGGAHGGEYKVAACLKTASK
jgi:hypothetical protein